MFGKNKNEIDIGKEHKIGSKLSIKAINKELERLHKLLDTNSYGEMTQGKRAANSLIWERIVKLEDILLQITKRYNGLEY